MFMGGGGDMCLMCYSRERRGEKFRCACLTVVILCDGDTQNILIEPVCSSQEYILLT